MKEYIDREGLIKFLDSLQQPKFPITNGFKFISIIDAIKVVSERPTVDAKPIVHAHWIEGQTDNPKIHNILCSNCFNGYPSKGHANSQYTKDRFKWCPSCGLKMDENEHTLEYADRKET